jgi:ATP-dependent DNA helicase RecG
MTVSEMNILNSSAQYLKGIGPKRAQALEKLGFKTIHDLFYLFPRRYDDRTKIKTISELQEGDTVSVQGKILTLGVRYFGGRGNFQMVFGDETGILNCMWFNQPYLKRVFTKDDPLILYGKVTRFGKRFQMQNPEYEKVTEDSDTTIHSGRIVPIYPLVSGLYQRSLRQSLWNLIENHIGLLTDYLPEGIRLKFALIPLGDAVSEIHFPTSPEKYKAARRRLVFDEFFLFELRLFSRIQKIKKNASAYPFEAVPETFEEFSKSLPFELTNSQKQALEIISRDLESATPMTRLLQGDVGSGKTVVAASIFLAAFRVGLQSVFLAPTETLAEQHFITLKQFLGPYFRDRLALLTGSLTEKEKEKIREDLKTNKTSLVIGTHALLQDTVDFEKLGFIVIDEQHKFGVKQRGKLLSRERRPHVLLMTATPIPRTLAMTLYGDLGSVLLSELPKGRHPIHTRWLQKKDEEKVFEVIRKHLTAGEQGYFVYPAIEESQQPNRVSCETDLERIQKLFPGHRVELIHGRLATETRAQRMEDFRKGKIQILVSTSVIEVGIDNPNATFMVIQGAEFFGLTQLHQLRGRVGRGAKPSVCFLLSEAMTDEAKARFEVMQATQDGFKIAEEDLKLRGPGDFLGTRQSGLPLFRLANLITDQELLEKARASAHETIEEDPDLKIEAHQPLKNELGRYETQFSE